MYLSLDGYIELYFVLQMCGRNIKNFVLVEGGLLYEFGSFGFPERGVSQSPYA